jgi:hypothetical protein
MTTFSRLINSPVHAFQFKEIELDEADKNADLSVKVHRQLDKQFAAFKEAKLPINIGTFDFARFTSFEELTLFISANVFGQSRIVLHELKFGDWLVIEPLMLEPAGTVMTDQDFQDEYGQYAPRPEDDPSSE